MAKIIRERTREKIVEYYREFVNTKTTQRYSFPCNKDGNLLDLNEIAKENYNNCITSEHYKDEGIIEYEKMYTSPAILLCDCGQEIFLENQYLGACECPKCEQWYNLFGQKLKPPHMWED